MVTKCFEFFICSFNSNTWYKLSRFFFSMFPLELVKFVTNTFLHLLHARIKVKTASNRLNIYLSVISLWRFSVCKKSKRSSVGHDLQLIFCAGMNSKQLCTCRKITARVFAVVIVVIVSHTLFTFLHSKTAEIWYIHILARNLCAGELNI